MKRYKLPERVRQKITLDTRAMIVRTVWQQLMIAVGAALSALGYTVFQVPFNIAAGGVTGLGIIANHLTGFPVSAFFLLINIPLFVLGYYQLGRWRFVWSSLTAVMVFTAATETFVRYLPEWMDAYPITQDALLAAIYAGALFGIGTGMIYRFGGTIGGTSITARIIYNKTGYPMSQSYLYTDLVIILAAGLLFSLETALLAIVTLVLVGLFSDFVLEGTSQTRTVSIITEKPDAVRHAVMYELQRGVSYWEVTGGYSQKTRTMLFFTALRSRIYDIKFVVSRVDPDAFMVVGISQQTWGGYNAPKIRQR